MTSRFQGKVVIETVGTGIGAGQASYRRIERPMAFLNHPKGNQINFKMREELFDAILD
jgi:hypothetical protein